MSHLKDWNYYWNEEQGDRFRANLVYTAYVSPDQNTFCMSFHRDPAYHSNLEENKLWTEELLTERFNREISFYEKAKAVMPVADVLDIDIAKREIYLRWPKDDFYMMGYRASYDQVLPNWQYQMKERFQQMWELGILKFSMHPNSWIVYEDNILRPINWFFTFDKNEEDKSIADYLIQLSDSRQDKLGPILESSGIDINKKYDLKILQAICFESFRHNYPSDLIDQLLILQRTTL